MKFKMFNYVFNNLIFIFLKVVKAKTTNVSCNLHQFHEINTINKLLINNQKKHKCSIYKLFNQNYNLYDHVTVSFYIIILF